MGIQANVRWIFDQSEGSLILDYVKYADFILSPCRVHGHNFAQYLYFYS